MLENVTGYVLTPHSIFGVIIDEKAVVTEIGICHSCLTYFEGLSFWPGRSSSWKYFQVDNFTVEMLKMRSTSQLLCLHKVCNFDLHSVYSTGLCR